MTGILWAASRRAGEQGFNCQLWLTGKLRGGAPAWAISGRKPPPPTSNTIFPDGTLCHQISEYQGHGLLAGCNPIVPSGPVLKSAFAFTHSRLVSLDADRNVREDAHVPGQRIVLSGSVLFMKVKQHDARLCAFHRFNSFLDSIFARLELLGAQPGALKHSQAKISIGKHGAFG